MYNKYHCSALCAELFHMINRDRAVETAKLGLDWGKFSEDVHTLSISSYRELPDVDRGQMLGYVMKFLVDLLNQVSHVSDPRETWKKLGYQEHMVRTWLGELYDLVSPEMHLWFYRNVSHYFGNPHDDGLVE